MTEPRPDGEERSNVGLEAAATATDGSEPTTTADATVHETRRWRGVVAVALAAVAVGIVADRPDVVMLSTLGIVFAAYPGICRTPSVELELERTLDEHAPEAGDRVEVTVTVRNVGDRHLPDLRIVDGVPPALDVCDGSPRHGAALRPGASATFSYSVAAERGKHGFEPTTIVARDPSGGREVETAIRADTEIDCSMEVSAPPLRSRTLDAIGHVRTSGGSDVEFDRIREYRRGDPMNRIDWNSYARTGEPATVEYRKEEAATVVVLVDARRTAYRGQAGRPHAVAESVSAAQQLVESLAAGRNQVGIAVIGIEFGWLLPGAGRAHVDRAKRMLRNHESLSGIPPGADGDHDAQVEELQRRLSENAQVLVLSPLHDEYMVDTVRRLAAFGHPTSVISPDATGAATVGQRLAGVERRNRLSELRRSGILVVDWQPPTPLAAAISNVTGRQPG